MRDIPAVILAVLLVFFALRLATSLTRDRRRRRQERAAIVATGQRIVAEIPGDDGMTFFTEDVDAFHYRERTMPKHAIAAARVLINGAPIAASVRAGSDGSDAVPRDIVEDQPAGIARDRWDVAIDVAGETVLVPCGAIRERISQELARRIFGAVRSTIESPGS